MEQKTYQISNVNGITRVFNILCERQKLINVPAMQCFISSHVQIYQLDKYDKGGVLTFYLKDIALKLVHVFKLSIEGFLIEDNIFRKKIAARIFLPSSTK